MARTSKTVVDSQTAKLDAFITAVDALDGADSLVRYALEDCQVRQSVALKIQTGYRYTSDGIAMSDKEWTALEWFGVYRQSFRQNTDGTFQTEDCRRFLVDANGISKTVPEETDRKPMQAKDRKDCIRQCGLRVISYAMSDANFLTVDSTVKTSGTVKAAEHNSVVAERDKLRAMLIAAGIDPDTVA